MRITAITQSLRDSEKVNIFLDYEFWCSLTKNDLLHLKLFKDSEITFEQKLEIEEYSKKVKDFLKVRNYNLARPHSIYEIRNFCAKKNISKKSTQEIIDKLCNAGELDDDKFATWFFEYKIKKKNYSIVRVKSELKKRGVAQGIVDKLSKVSEDNEIPKIKSLLQKMSMNLQKKGKNDTKRKIISRLVNRGFNYKDINRALEEDGFIVPT